jgi:hypothetical protein
VPLLTKKRDALQAEVSKLAGSAADYKAMEKKSIELGKLQDDLDAKEMR